MLFDYNLDVACVMFQDQEAWRALCRCLAESCRGTEANQSYCTHLVPICIQRCNHRNIELLMVLQSLLQNHNRNIALFVECNGMSLFQREFLQHDICLQLLATIVQSSKEAATLIVNTDICQQLRRFLQLYGPHSQVPTAIATL
uniref:SFRICE_000794 n=1 Tax=Spodoptera frugiperda TaxID=7108 RepID=A0A2H1WW06_SPOFR